MDTILIEKQLEKIPEIIKKAFFSNSVAEEIAKIGENNGLLLDQIDDLIEETGYMIIGLKPSGDFINIISKKLKIESTAARKISTEINDTVLKEIRNEIIKLNSSEDIKDDYKPTSTSTTPPPPITDPAPIEKAGEFTIEKPPVGITTEPVVVKKDEVLKAIEDPEELLEAPSIDHMLTTPVVSTEKVVEVKKVDVAPVEKKPYTLDPYREQI